jgi:DNA mismatch repair protein MutL
MGRIRILSDQVANQIAAGEVVERPASVVKELLENSLDAGATRVRIEVEGGGRKLIRLVDNGHGMVRDDALLAFERHATSKLHSSDDLLEIRTLGFRGEALPSIASVSRLRLETRATEDAAGTAVELAGGKILSVEDAGMPAGTTIWVRDLFYNTPARRKFLKSEQTELAHIAALVTHYALAYPERHFELHSATQALLIAPAVASTGDRLFQIFGRDTAALMLHARRVAGAASLEARSRLRASRSRIPAYLGLCLQAGVAEAQPQLDLRLRQPPPGPRPRGPACADRGLPQHPSADVVPGGAAVSGDAAAGGRRERASGQDRGALPPAELCA